MQNTKIIEALELGMALIGCPPGDNAKADAYRKMEQALSLLRSQEGEPVAEECATKPIIGNVRERWEELGYNEPDRAAERFRGDPWKAWYNGWIEGRWPLMVPAHSVGSLSDEEIERIAHRQAPTLGDPWSDEQKRIRIDIQANIKAALRYARDHGYLSTDGGLKHQLGVITSTSDEDFNALVDIVCDKLLTCHASSKFMGKKMNEVVARMRRMDVAVGRSSGEGSASDGHAPNSTTSPDNTTEL